MRVCVCQCTADFECGHIDEEHLCRIFFADGRPVDQAGLRQMLVRDCHYGHYGSSATQHAYGPCSLTDAGQASMSMLKRAILSQVCVPCKLSQDFMSCHTCLCMHAAYPVSCACIARALYGDYACMQRTQYRFLDGMETLLTRLHAAGYEMHALSNYPVWYQIIEEKLRLSRFMDWTFVSCVGPMKVREQSCTCQGAPVFTHMKTCAYVWDL